MICLFPDLFGRRRWLGVSAISEPLEEALFADRLERHLCLADGAAGLLQLALYLRLLLLHGVKQLHHAAAPEKQT